MKMSAKDSIVMLVLFATLIPGRIALADVYVAQVSQVNPAGDPKTATCNDDGSECDVTIGLLLNQDVKQDVTLEMRFLPHTVTVKFKPSQSEYFYDDAEHRLTLNDAGRATKTIKLFDKNNDGVATSLVLQRSKDPLAEVLIKVSPSP